MAIGERQLETVRTTKTEKKTEIWYIITYFWEVFWEAKYTVFRKNTHSGFILYIPLSLDSVWIHTKFLGNVYEELSILST